MTVEYDLSGNVAFVTGAARGMGRAHAVGFAESGADVVAVDLGAGGSSGEGQYELAAESDLRETVELVEAEGQEALGFPVDVREESQVAEAVDAALDAFGGIDVLVNNAGVFNLGEVPEMPESKWDQVVDTNLKGVWLCSKHVSRHMIDRGDGGKIVNIASVGGLGGFPEAAHYSGSKHGVIGLTRSMALEFLEHDINVNAVCPGSVATRIILGIPENLGDDVWDSITDVTGAFNVKSHVTEGEDVPMDPREITKAVLWLSSPDADFVNGVALPVDTGYSAK